MRWKSFKQEKPLDGQRILIYAPYNNERSPTAPCMAASYYRAYLCADYANTDIYYRYEIKD